MIDSTQNLVDDFGGGRIKSSEKSQLFYSLALDILFKLNGKSFAEVECFSEYLKEVAKKLSHVNIIGKEDN